MKLSQFKFKLPEEQIAQHPVGYRDESRLMVLHKKNGEIEHHTFNEILNFYKEGDLFIFNDTKVFPAVLYGNKEKTNARIQVYLLRELNPDIRLWEVLVDPARKIRIGNKLYFGENNELVAEVIDNTTSRGRSIRFLYDGDHDEFKKILFSLGHTPLPPMIHREPEPEDSERYQTIYAKNEGAVMAPMAGTHFSREILKKMEIFGIEKGYITLHCSLGNFREIDVEDLTKHKIDSEQMFVEDEVCNILDETKKKGGKVCAVGTSTIKALETAATTNGRIKPYEGWTNKFIFPPYKFSIADHMISNFQMPFSTMLMIEAAFGGYEYVMNAYSVALKEGYRFGPYGDALLIID